MKRIILAFEANLSAAGSGSAFGMRIRIQEANLMRIHADPDPDPDPVPKHCLPEHIFRSFRARFHALLLKKNQAAAVLHVAATVQLPNDTTNQPGDKWSFAKKSSRRQNASYMYNTVPIEENDPINQVGGRYGSDHRS